MTLAIGIDIGGTKTAYGFIDNNGKIIAEGSIPTCGHYTIDDFIATLKNELMPHINQLGISNIIGIGIGAPNGNFFTGEIAFAPNLPWHGVIPLAKLFTNAFALKTIVTNDANAAAIGEMKYGIAKNKKDFVLVTLGTGLGSGFVANGQLIYGHDGFAGELGHVTAVRDGRKCGCGRLGCLERYASATGIAITAQEWLEERYTPSLLRTHEGSITALQIQIAAQQGDELALEIFDYTAKILGQTLADVVAITSPEAIIFFGGLANAGDLLLIPVKKYMEDNLLNIYKNKVTLLHSALPGADAAILGASALVW